MSSPSQVTDAPVPQEEGGDAIASPDGWRDSESRGLTALRAELDGIDDALHDLLMRRAGVVERVARAGKRGALRPGREAVIIRRLLGRHHGGLPANCWPAPRRCRAASAWQCAPPAAKASTSRPPASISAR
jgi:chorismate mutase